MEQGQQDRDARGGAAADAPRGTRRHLGIPSRLRDIGGDRQLVGLAVGISMGLLVAILFLVFLVVLMMTIVLARWVF